MKDDQSTELLFSYGTLRDESVQLSIFGRRLNGRTDTLTGYRLMMVQVDDPDFAARNGAEQRDAHFTGDGSDVVEGVVYSVNAEELKLADEYEPVDYKRVFAQMKSGVKAWVYVKTLLD
jgi:gamma-glutamylcyclotransferase (GGCT)/AIG2-like uncharacterized protein YtfP